jgi:hypothetical protein
MTSSLVIFILSSPVKTCQTYFHLGCSYNPATSWHGTWRLGHGENLFLCQGANVIHSGKKTKTQQDPKDGSR